MAHADPRIVAGAALGSLVTERGDRWSDLDLTFALADGANVNEVLADWTRDMAREFDAVQLFDLPLLTTIYRVFLLPGNLQVDLSFTPRADFHPRGPKFTLLFGEAGERKDTPRPSAEEVFGLGVHHAVRARFCIERGRPWQAEYMISGVRDQALALACRRHGLDGSYARGFDELPAETRARAEHALVRSTDRMELMRALAAACEALRAEAVEVHELASKLESHLREAVD
jgi:hypothetical protein